MTLTDFNFFYKISEKLSRKFRVGKKPGNFEKTHGNRKNWFLPEKIALHCSLVIVHKSGPILRDNNQGRRYKGRSRVTLFKNTVRGNLTVFFMLIIFIRFPCTNISFSSSQFGNPFVNKFFSGH
jgi:hypothetical protein